MYYMYIARVKVELSVVTHVPEERMTIAIIRHGVPKKCDVPKFCEMIVERTPRIRIIIFCLKKYKLRKLELRVTFQEDIIYMAIQK